MVTGGERRTGTVWAEGQGQKRRGRGNEIVSLCESEGMFESSVLSVVVFRWRERKGEGTRRDGK